jgi:hypothetical protein
VIGIGLSSPKRVKVVQLFLGLDRLFGANRSGRRGIFLLIASREPAYEPSLSLFLGVRCARPANGVIESCLWSLRRGKIRAEFCGPTGCSASYASDG